MTPQICDKKKVRPLLLEMRTSIPPAQTRAMSKAARDNLRQLEAWQNAKEVMLYMPIRNEVDTTPLLTELFARNATVLLPRCREDEPGVMDVACVDCIEHLSPGKFGIPEPDIEFCLIPEAFRPDIILVPGVGFDKKGHRLGYGAGFYDRFLQSKSLDNTLLVGMAYTFQIVDALPADKWDIPVQVIITEDDTRWI